MYNGLAWVKYDSLWGVLDIEETINSANTTTTTTTTTTPPVTVIELGDINGDNLIDAVDATVVSIEYANLATGGDSTLTDEQKKVADVNGDGFIDSVDSTYILRYYAKVSAGENIAFEEFVKNN